MISYVFVEHLDFLTTIKNYKKVKKQNTFKYLVEELELNSRGQFLVQLGEWVGFWVDEDTNLRFLAFVSILSKIVVMTLSFISCNDFE